LHFELDTWITFWKRQFSRQHPATDCEWQRRAFHHRLRDRVEYEEKLVYVQQNPVRKNLVAQVGDWKFQGRVHDIQW